MKKLNKPLLKSREPEHTARRLDSGRTVGEMRMHVEATMGEAQLAMSYENWDEARARVQTVIGYHGTIADEFEDGALEMLDAVLDEIDEEEREVQERLDCLTKFEAQARADLRESYADALQHVDAPDAFLSRVRTKQLTHPDQVQGKRITFMVNACESDRGFFALVFEDGTFCALRSYVGSNGYYCDDGDETYTGIDYKPIQGADATYMLRRIGVMELEQEERLFEALNAIIEEDQEALDRATYARLHAKYGGEEKE